MIYFKETCIWMSYRYAIGRSSIASCCHAADIVRYGLDWIPENRREFTARDIRDCINNQLMWTNNIRKDGYSNKYDILSCILKYMFDNNIEDSELFYLQHVWQVNVDTGEVTIQFQTDIKPSEMDRLFSLFTSIHDYLPWIKLANFLDKEQHCLVDVNFNNQQTSRECFIIYDQLQDKTIMKYYVPCDAFQNNPSILSYLSPEYIINHD